MELVVFRMELVLGRRWTCFWSWYSKIGDDSAEKDPVVGSGGSGGSEGGGSMGVDGAEIRLDADSTRCSDPGVG